MKKNILIDIGNTACKVVSCIGRELGETYRYSGDDITEFILYIIRKECSVENPHVIVLCTVRHDDSQMQESLRSLCDRLVVLNLEYVRRELLNHKDTYPEIAVLGNMPEGMGADRMAAILAAHSLYPTENIIVFDFGTATTVEFINGRTECDEPLYLGGSISLGLQTRYRALSHFTRKIPLLNPNDFLAEHRMEEISTIGYDLDTALAAGNILGIMFEIRGYAAAHPDRRLIMTGGDSEFFANSVEKAEAISDLVLYGLALIAEYND